MSPDTSDSPSRKSIAASNASHRRHADSVNVWSTVCRSNAERLNSSERRRLLQFAAARIQRNSLSSRAFSMAITAWAANVVTSAICLSVNGRTALRCKTITPIAVPSRISGTPSIVRTSNLSCRPACIPDRHEYPGCELAFAQERLAPTLNHDPKGLDAFS